MNKIINIILDELNDLFYSKFTIVENDVISKIQKNNKSINLNSIDVIAFHGSTANHDGFDVNKIETGESNTSFGYELYFTGFY